MKGSCIKRRNKKERKKRVWVKGKKRCQRERGRRKLLKIL